MSESTSKLVFFGISNKGMQRETNEDHFIVADLTRKVIGVYDNRVTPDLICHQIGDHGTIVAVADGLGGHEKGEVASHIAVEVTVKALLQDVNAGIATSEWLLTAVKEAHVAICQNPVDEEEEVRGMGSTLTAVHIGPRVITVAQVGDSRAYSFRDGHLSMLTEDQTLVRLLQKAGILTDTQAQTHPSKHVILQALGHNKTIIPEVRSFSSQDGDYLLLCTDGLTSYVDDQTIKLILASNDDEYTHCQRLVEAANAAGGTDDITVLLVRLHIPLQSTPRRAAVSW